VIIGLCLLAWPATSPIVEAHPLGLTRVVVTFTPDRAYTIDIIVDPESLLAKLEILSGRQPSGIVPLDQLPARIGALQRVLLAQTRVLFDEQPVTPAFAYVPGAIDASSIAPAATAPTATVRLTGIVPPGATRFRFNYGLVLGSYVLSVRSAAAGGSTPNGGAASVSASTGAAQVTLWIAGGQDSDPIDLTRGLVPASRLAVARQYFVLGFEHILPKGVDHILFVIGIFLLSTAWRPILLQVTTFTIAHSITLGLTMYGIVSLPSSIVEPLIALSITYVAIENLWTSELKPWRLALVFAFGLLHGMGFAGVLRELGLPRSEFLTALLTFNLGVEGGQLAVILIALLLVGWWRQRERVRYRQRVVVPVSVLIAAVGAYWTIVRALG
jgi:hypothetical protein